jgi:5-methylcytosine-specific restriction protein B
VRPLWDEAASPEWDELVRRMLPALRQGADAGGPDEAGQPEPDADLLERLQHALAAPVGWEDALGQAAVRAAALGVAVPRWGLLVDALRGAVASLPDEHEDAVTGAPAPFALAPVTVELANELLMPQGPLQRIVDLLQRRRQVILYGPPGTGKTWLARRLARHAFSGADVRLVQFHPSYTYEDFVEGYRPRTRDGALTYELIRGTLRELAAQAMDQPERPHLVIIDEINRGNLPKIFGELYFLLEYRDEPLRLQYSSDVEFRLPPNLYFIGTMNTADRSIALLDAALRRRFAFVELSPLRVPVDGLLQRWLERHGLEPEPHVLLDTLNTLLLEADGDRDLAIGPSYFLNREGTAPDLETIWEYDILPLLAERFYGTEYDVEARFGLAAVRAEAARRADMEP